MFKLAMAGLTAAASLFAAASHAATYNFNVLYTGSGTASLAPGSDDLLGVTLNVGDSFTYTLSAQPGFQWNTVDSQTLDTFLALWVGPSSARTGDVSGALLDNGVSELSFSAPGVATCCVHLGTNEVAVPSGLHFNQWVLNDTITSGAPTIVNTLLPWPDAAPEEHFAGVITYTGPAGVPEPAAWALLILGVGGLGARLRARRPLAV